jgi:hypothetical protein
MEQLIDRVLNERYRIQSLLGRQTGRSTFLAQDLQTEQSLVDTDRQLEITIPPRGFHPGLIFAIFFAIGWNSFLVMWYAIALSTWSSGGWFAALFSICHLAAGIYITWSIIFTLFGTKKLQITQSEISLFSVLFGRRFATLRADRQQIDKIEVTALTYGQDARGNRISIPPHINIWAGTKQFTLGSKNTQQSLGSDEFKLTKPELAWLVNELADWLDLPVTKE